MKLNFLGKLVTEKCNMQNMGARKVFLNFSRELKLKWNNKMSACEFKMYCEFISEERNQNG